MTKLGRLDRWALVSLGLLACAGLLLSLVATSVRAGTTTVAIRNNDFVPPRITIRVGDTVTWTNEDLVPHDAFATDESWQTSMLTTGQSGSITFTTVGTVPYVCSLHLFMRGEVVVEAASGGMPATDTIVGDASASDPAADGHLVALLAGLVGLAAGIRLLRRRDRPSR